MALYLLLAGLSVVFLVPLAWMISTSLKEGGGIATFPPNFIPNPATLENYVYGWTKLPFYLFLRNTVVITLLSTFGSLLSCSVVAYGFARVRFPGRDFLFMVLLGTMMLPYQVTIIPLFILYRVFGWYDTYYPLIVPAFFASPFYVFLLRQFFLTLPNDLFDAARVDGANDLQIIARIVLPLTQPALATVAIFSFMAHWNDFIGPLIFLSTLEKFTLQLGLRSFQSSMTWTGTLWGPLMAMSTAVLLPVVAMFFFAQKYFVRGIVMSGIKG